jgi:hypothetical protein
MGDTLTTTFTLPAGREQVSCSAEASSTLQPGSWTEIPNTATPPQHTFTIPATDARQFVRIRVSVPE